MPDPSAITNALLAKLGADATLLALVPNGVYRDVGPANATRFVKVSLIIGDDVRAFSGRSFEDREYLVEAIVRSDSGGNVAAAAARIDALLDPQPPLPPPTLTAAGYELMTMERTEPVEYTERDEEIKTLFWYRRGGHYRVVMSLA